MIFVIYLNGSLFRKYIAALASGPVRQAAPDLAAILGATDACSAVEVWHMRLTFRNARSSFPVPVRPLGTGYAGVYIPELSIVTVCTQSLLLVCDMSVTSLCADMLGGVPVLFFWAALASGSIPKRLFRIRFKTRYALVVLGEFRALPHALLGCWVPERSTRVCLSTRWAGHSVLDYRNIV